MTWPSPSTHLPGGRAAPSVVAVGAGAVCVDAMVADGVGCADTMAGVGAYGVNPRPAGDGMIKVADCDPRSKVAPFPWTALSVQPPKTLPTFNEKVWLVEGSRQIAMPPLGIRTVPITCKFGPSAARPSGAQQIKATQDATKVIAVRHMGMIFIPKRGSRFSKKRPKGGNPPVRDPFGRI